jgi:hypothetical protein
MTASQRHSVRSINKHEYTNRKCQSISVRLTAPQFERQAKGNFKHRTPNRRNCPVNDRPTANEAYTRRAETQTFVRYERSCCSSARRQQRTPSLRTFGTNCPFGASPSEKQATINHLLRERALKIEEVWNCIKRQYTHYSGVKKFVIIAKAVSQIKTNGADIGESPISINALYRQPKWRNPKHKALTGSQKVPRKWQVQVRWARSLGKERTGELVSKFGTPNKRIC